MEKKEILTLHLEYTFPGGHLEEIVQKEPFTTITTQWISMDLPDSSVHFMAVGEYHTLAMI